ncbi:TonB-dependent siderophore receptor [Parvularcula sp. ZS-1/3]|uniref:TonB-dependent siderophore receptor n=1 Tax=Parvularcula mediterranea TaxID=2732508 RepID=A0A7Y3RMN4_9PROT|nr:TonB-dependent siderophore receptor [Parvularcula mediterranea]NNU16903.1 TonB-dependent siderophore receptor [Parvularcula mediterranea]
MLSALLLSTAATQISANASVSASNADIVDEIVVQGRVLYTSQVNALKSPTPILDVPQSLSIIGAEEIVQRGFTSIGEIITYTPGVNNSQGEGHRDAIVFRGVRSTADFFIDGVRDDVQYYRPLYNLEQVEILRGPNALFFGRGGTGGVLNRVMKKADLSEDFTGFRTSVNSFGAYDIWIDTNKTVGENGAFRLNAMYETLDNHRDFFDGERIGINPAFRFEVTPATTIDLSYEYIDHQRFIDRGIPTGADGEPVEALQDIVFGDPELNDDRIEAHLWRAQVQHRFSDSLKGRFSAFYGDYDKFYQNFYAVSYDPQTEVVGLDGYVDTTQRQNFILSGDLVGEFETGSIGHTIVTGVEYIDTVNNNDRFNPVWDQTNDDVEFFDVMRPLMLSGGVGVNASGQTTTVAFSDLNDDTEADVRVTSAYIQDEIALSDQLDLVLGLRFDSFEIDVLNVPADERRSRTDDNIAPRVGLVYKPLENISIYGSYSETFLPRSGEQFANINGAANALDPDEFTNLEAGIKWDFIDGLSLTAAVFQIEQSSPQVADNDPETLDVIDSETNGFELQLQGRVTDRWFITGGYSYLEGEIVDRNGPTGLTPRELPENMFSLWNAFDVTDKFGLGFGVTHQGESFITNANTAVLPSFTRFDAAGYYDINEKLRIQVNIENLTDELYFPNAHSTHQATVAAPLNARFTLSGRF